MRREGVAGDGQGGDCQRGRGGEDGSLEGKADRGPRRKGPPECKWFGCKDCEDIVIFFVPGKVTKSAVWERIQEQVEELPIGQWRAQ